MGPLFGALWSSLGFRLALPGLLWVSLGPFSVGSLSPPPPSGLSWVPLVPSWLPFWPFLAQILHLFKAFATDIWPDGAQNGSNLDEILV